jgi:hypothetical protein
LIRVAVTESKLSPYALAALLSLILRDRDCVLVSLRANGS